MQSCCSKAADLRSIYRVASTKRQNARKPLPDRDRNRTIPERYNKCDGKLVIAVIHYNVEKFLQFGLVAMALNETFKYGRVKKTQKTQIGPVFEHPLQILNVVV